MMDRDGYRLSRRLKDLEDGFLPLSGGDMTGDITVNGETVWHGGNDGSLRDNTHTAHSAKNLAVGWYTIATNAGDRAIARFGLVERASSRHQSVVFYASHHFGKDCGNNLSVLHYARYSGTPIRYIRIKDGGTYDGAVLQVYIDDSYNNLVAFLMGDNLQARGWVLQDWIPDATTPPDVSNYGSFAESARVDLDEINDGGMTVNGDIYAGSKTNQYKVWHEGNDGVGSGLNADMVDGLHVASTSGYGKTFNYVPRVNSDGVMEVGRYIDFHYSSNDLLNYYTRLDVISDKSLRISSSNGNVEIGPKNTNNCHIYTDRSYFYFNKSMFVIGNFYPATTKVYQLGNGNFIWNGMYLAPPTTTTNNTIRRNNSTSQLLYYSSSERFKERIRRPKDEGIDPDIIYHLKPRVFDEKPDERRVQDQANILGLIAEEVAEVCPDLVFYDDDGTVQSYSEDALMMLMIGAIQKQRGRVIALEKALGRTPPELPEKGSRLRSGQGMVAKKDRRAEEAETDK